MLTARPILLASGLSLRDFIAAVRASSSTVYRYLDSPMPLDLFDKWCVRIERHPAEVIGFESWVAASYA